MPFYTQFTNWQDVERNQLLRDRLAFQQGRAGRLDVAAERQQQIENALARRKFGLEQDKFGLEERKEDRARGMEATKYIHDRLYGVKDDQSWNLFLNGLGRIAPEISKQMRRDMPGYNERELKGFKSIVYGKEPEPYTLGPRGQRFKGKEKIAENLLYGSRPTEGTGTTTKTLLTNYKSAINQTLKKYGVESGLVIKPDGTIDLEAYLSGKKSVYQTLQKKAAAGNVKASEDLEKIDYWYKQIDALTGVPAEITQKTEEERRLDATDPFRVK